MKVLSGILFVFLVLPARASWGEVRIGVLPFENVSGIREARSQVMPPVIEELKKKGYTILQREPLEKFLKEERIRYLDFLPSAAAQKMARTYGLEGIVTGTVLSYQAGKNPQLGLSVRVVSAEGTLVWRKTVSMTGEEQEGILGLGRVDTIRNLVPIATKRLFETFRVKGKITPAENRPPRSVAFSKPRFYRSRSLGSEMPLNIAVLPIENLSPARGAGRIVQNLIVSRLSGKEGVSPTEPGDVREGLIAEGFRVIDRMDEAQLRAIGKRLGTKYIVGGIIYKFEEARGVAGIPTPEVELYLMMLETETGKTVWSCRHLRKGSDFGTVLEFGKIRTLVSLSEQVIEEMVRTIAR